MLELLQDQRRLLQACVFSAEPARDAVQVQAPVELVSGDTTACAELPGVSRVVEGRLLATVTLLGHEMRCMTAYMSNMLATRLAPRRTGGRQRRKRRQRKQRVQLYEGISDDESDGGLGYTTAEES